MLATIVLAGKPAIIADKSLHALKKFKKRHLQQKSTILPEFKRTEITEEEFASLQNTSLNNSILLPKPSVESELHTLVGGLVVKRCYPAKVSNPLQVLKKVFRDTVVNQFRVYPNPLPRNSTLHIQWKQKEFGNHVLELFNQSGQLVFSKEIYIDQEAKLLEISMPQLSAGDYFLRFTSKGNERSHSEKLIIASPIAP